MQLTGSFCTRARLGAWLVTGLCASACATPSSGGASSGAQPKTLSFELPDVSGKIVRTADFGGRVVLVDVWATWCRPCEASMPFYSELYTTFAPKGFTILAVSVDEKDEDVARYLERRPLPFPVLRDPKGSVPSQLDMAIETMPTSVLIGGDGRIIHVHAGFTDGDREAIEKRVREALEALDSQAPGDAPKVEGR